jgi:Tol biopolymer transport system component
MQEREPSRLAAALLLPLLISCGESSPPPGASEAPDAAPETAAAGAPVAPAAPPPTQLTPVTVDEGTNLSFALRDDGQEMILSLQGVLFRMPATGGAATAITDYYLDAREPDYTPDGNQIVFQGYRNGNWDLWTISASGVDEAVTLTDDPFDDREPQVSPDGTRVAFSSDRSGNYDIWLYDLEAGSLVQVTTSPEDEHAPNWSPDGTQIAFAATPDRSRSALRRIEVATGISATITEVGGVINGVSWHPEGRSITFQHRLPAATELKTIATAGGEVTTVSAPDDDVFPFRSAWLPDGTLLYAANGGIQAAPPTGARTTLAFEATFELDRTPYPRKRRNHDDLTPRRALGLAQPAISPDGSLITFSALGDLWLWEPDTRTLENLTESVFAERSPAFAPDGTRIAYVSDRPGDGRATASSLWIYDLTTGEHSRVNLPAGGVSAPAWSPDARSIAVFTTIPTNPLAGQLTVVNPDDGSATPVHSPLPAQGISWSRDGEFLATTQLAPYSGRYREGVYRLNVISRISDQRYEVEPVPHKNITSVALTPVGQAMTYVQDGQLWRQGLSEDFQPQGYPEPLTAGLTDTPSWSSGGHHLVYMSGDRMYRMQVDTGAAEDITPEIVWEPERLNATWTVLVGQLFDGTGDAYLENRVITIENHRIQSIEPYTTYPEGFVPDLDASDKAAFPGLFEMHGHMGEISESQGRAWLAFGVTSVRDPGSDPYVAKERQEMWDSGRSFGPRTVVTGYLTDGNRVYYAMAEGIGSDVHLERALDRTARLELDFIKTYVRLPDHRQKRVIEFAHDLGIPVTSHELFPAVAHGADHVEHIGGTSRRGYQPKVSSLGRSYGDVVALLAASGMGITPTAVLPGYSVIATEGPDFFDNPQFAHFYPTGRQAAAMLSSAAGSRAGVSADNNGALLRELTAAGALVVSGTDAPFVPYGAGLHAELRLYARAGLSPAEVLRTATVNAARAAGVDHDIGTLKPGMIADLVIVDGDPLADIGDADNVFMTIKNGRGYLLETLLIPSVPRTGGSVSGDAPDESLTIGHADSRQ